jgi:hypothetical protein
MEYYHKHLTFMGVGGLAGSLAVGWALMNGAPLFGLLFPVWFIGGFFWRLKTPVLAIREDRVEVPAVPIDLASDESIAIDELESFDIEEGGWGTLFYDRWVIRGVDKELWLTPTIIPDDAEDDIRERLDELADD